jgi:hypothetical protein
MASVPRLFGGQTIVCMASGPSLCDEDVQFVRGKAPVIVVNTTYQKAPWADVLHGCDLRWWIWHKGVPEFTGLKYTLTRSLNSDVRNKWGVVPLKRTGHTGLETNPSGLRTGSNGGYQAIGLARHLGASRILLLGYDMQRGPKGEEHWHGDHPNRSRSPYELFVKRFATIVEPLKAEGIEVINCSRRTALECWPQMSIQDALSPVRVEAVA